MRRAAVIGMSALLLFSVAFVVRESDAGELKSVVQRDAIPAIGDPRYHDGPLERTARVIGVEIAGASRAYPVAVLNYHEIVNDELGGRPLVVTYCPLCSSGLAFDREVGGRVLEFKVSGRLYKNDLVMYDVQTSSLWSQLEGRAISGQLAGTELRLHSSTFATYETFKAFHPESDVLLAPSSNPEYATDPYAAYEASNFTLYPPVTKDASLYPKDFVHGVEVNGTSVAYPLFRLRSSQVVNDVVGGERIVVASYNDAVSSFRAGDRTFSLHFGFTMRDESGNRYNMVTGESLDNGTSLERVPGVTLYYFAWRDFHPDSSIWGGPSTGALPESHVPLLSAHPLFLTLALVGGTYAAVRLGRHAVAVRTPARATEAVDIVTGKRPRWLMEDGWRSTRLSVLWGVLFAVGALVVATESSSLLNASNTLLGFGASAAFLLAGVQYAREGLDTPSSRARSLDCTKEEASRRVSETLSLLGKRFVELDGVRFGGDAQAIRFEVTEPDTKIHIAGTHAPELYAAPFEGKHAAFIEELEDAFHGRFYTYESIVDLQDDP